MIVKSSISLTDSQDAFARTLVKEGRYSSLSAVVQQGLDLLRQKNEAEQAETEALKALLTERARGPFIGSKEFRGRIDDMLATRQRAYGLED